MAPRHAGKATILLSMFVAVLVIHRTIQGFSNLGKEGIEKPVGGINITHHKHRVRAHHAPQQANQEIESTNRKSGAAGVTDISTGDLQMTSDSAHIQDSACTRQHLQNFFTTINHSFVSMLKDLDQPVQTKLYLDCSADLTMIFDKLSATAFSPVKNNVVKNIERIRAVYNKDRQKYSTLQSIVMEDVKHNMHKDETSVSDSILWLTRSLLFVTEMFNNVEDQQYFSDAIMIAYGRVLKQYHNWFVQRIFSFIGPALPSKESAIAAFAVKPSDQQKSDFNECLYESLDIYNDALITVCAKLEAFFKTLDLVVLDRSKWKY